MKKILSFFLLLCLCIHFCSCGSEKEYAPSKGLDYELSEDGTYYIVTGLGSCNDSFIVIPEKYKNLPVCAVGDSAFRKTGITHVILPESIMQIAYDAFEDCSKLAFNEYGGAYYLGIEGNDYFALISVSDETEKDFKIHSDAEIVADCALWGAIIETLTIPKSISNIGNAAFYTCDSLESIDIANGVSSIASEAFGNCKSLSKVTIPESITIIENYTFAYCSSLSSVTLPLTTEYIGAYVFSNCENLMDITFKGTMAQWNNIEKDSLWDEYTVNYTVHCKDGDVKK